MKEKMNPQVDTYLAEGCMRCKFGGTPKCKVNNWRNELEKLRQIVLATGLKEEIKWGVPVYTHNGKNVVTVSALKESATIGFFKGVLLADKHGILQQQGNLQSDRLIKFTHVDEVEKRSELLVEYIVEAIEIEDGGQKVEFKKNPEPLPDELLSAFAEDFIFKTAFEALTPGRQRGYIIHFSQPKQSQTRVGRIEKCKQRIFEGLGMHDNYQR